MFIGLARGMKFGDRSMRLLFFVIWGSKSSSDWSSEPDSSTISTSGFLGSTEVLSICCWEESHEQKKRKKEKRKERN